MLTIAMMSATATVNAQDNQRDGNRPSPTEMMERRTQSIIEKYGLSDEQAQKLRELNEKYAKKMEENRPPRPDNDSIGAQRPQRPEGEDMDNGNGEMRPRHGGPHGGPHGGHMPFMKEYDEEFKAILTADQLSAYEADMKKMREERGQRRQRNNE